METQLRSVETEEWKESGHGKWDTEYRSRVGKSCEENGQERSRPVACEGWSLDYTERSVEGRPKRICGGNTR